MKQHIALILILSIFYTPLTMNASIFGEENVALTAILAEEIKQTTDIGLMVANLKKGIQVGQKTFSMIRETKRLYESAKNYTVEELIKNSLLGFCQGLGEGDCADIEQGIIELYDNAEYISKGDSKGFWAYQGRFDGKANDFYRKMIKGTNQAYMFPVIAPKMSKFYGYGKEPSEADKVIAESLVKSGMLETVNADLAQASFINAAADMFRKDADASNNIIAKGQAIQNAQAQQNLKNTTRSRQLQEAKAIEEAKKKAVLKKRRQLFREQYKKASEEAGKIDVFGNKNP